MAMGWGDQDLSLPHDQPHIRFRLQIPRMKVTAHYKTVRVELEK
jgi:hypothetical protein